MAQVNDRSFIHFDLMTRSFKLPGTSACDNIAHVLVHGKRNHEWV